MTPHDVKGEENGVNYIMDLDSQVSVVFKFDLDINLFNISKLWRMGTQNYKIQSIQYR